MEETKRVTGKKGFSLRDMVLCALFAAILAVSAWLTVPGEVPFTLQTFGVFAALGLLGGKRGTIAIALYLVLGAVGLPVFSGFRGGFGVLLGTHRRVHLWLFAVRPALLGADGPAGK